MPGSPDLQQLALVVFIPATSANTLPATVGGYPLQFALVAFLLLVLMHYTACTLQLALWYDVKHTGMCCASLNVCSTCACHAGGLQQ